MDPITALIVVGGILTAAKGVTEFLSEDRKEEALKLQQEQNQLAYQQKTLANYEMTNKLLDTQLAQASARGVGLGSPSLEAIRRRTVEVSSRQQKNLDVEESIFERNAKLEKENVRLTMASNLFGDVTSFASQVAIAGAK